MRLLWILRQHCRRVVQVSLISYVLCEKLIFEISQANSASRFDISPGIMGTLSAELMRLVATFHQVLTLSHVEHLLLEVVWAPHVGSLISSTHVEKGRLACHAASVILMA